jgi:hypothetical protein
VPEAAEAKLEPASVTAADPMLDTLYDSSNFAVKHTAARQIAARRDGPFRSIASVLAASEMTGEPLNEAPTKELGKVLRQMLGPQIQAVATDLAYSPCPRLSEAATDAAIASDPSIRREQLSGATEKEASPPSDADAQAILDA